MNIAPRFPWWIVANAIGTVVATAACTTFPRVIRSITRLRTSKLPKCPGAERAKEELEGWAIDLGAAERVEFAANLLLNLGKLQDELGERAAETQEPSQLATVATDLFELSAHLCSWLPLSRASARHIAYSYADLAGPVWHQIDPGAADSIKADVATLLEQRPKWVSATSQVLGMSATVAAASLATGNLRAFGKIMKQAFYLKGELRQEFEIRRELQRLRQSMEEASERRIPLTPSKKRRPARALNNTWRTSGEPQ